MSDNKTMTDEVILQVKDLKTYFYLDEGVVKAVDGISFDLHKGETMPELQSKFGYPILLFVMAVIAICELIYFKKKKWF